eukprot:6469443-Amphidinium_carterae.1
MTPIAGFYVINVRSRMPALDVSFAPPQVSIGASQRGRCAASMLLRSVLGSALPRSTTLGFYITAATALENELPNASSERLMFLV